MKTKSKTMFAAARAKPLMALHQMIFEMQRELAGDNVSAEDNLAEKMLSMATRKVITRER